MTVQRCARPGRPKRSRDATIYPTLAELDLTKQELYRARQIALIPDVVFEAYIARGLAGEGPLTKAGALRYFDELCDWIKAEASA